MTDSTPKANVRTLLDLVYYAGPDGKKREKPRFADHESLEQARDILAPSRMELAGTDYQIGDDEMRTAVLRQYPELRSSKIEKIMDQADEGRAYAEAIVHLRLTMPALRNEVGDNVPLKEDEIFEKTSPPVSYGKQNKPRYQNHLRPGS